MHQTQKINFLKIIPFNISIDFLNFLGAYKNPFNGKIIYASSFHYKNHLEEEMIIIEIIVIKSVINY